MKIAIIILGLLALPTILLTALAAIKLWEERWLD